MAFKDAKIGFFPSSTGHGGIVTIYDKESTLAEIRADTPYYDRITGTTNDDMTARRTYEALLDFCRQQSADNTVLGEWVVCFTIGKDGGGAARRLYADDQNLKITAAA